MNDDKRNFDKEAATWDEEPGRVRLADDVASAIREEIRLRTDMDVLDFGCGTGLLTLNLHPLIRSITGVDSSKRMLDVLRSKIKKLGLPDVSLRHLDLDRGDALEGSFHLVVSSMTLHHIKEIDPLLHQLHTVTLPGGHICIADLDPDGGKFHADNKGVFHFGFDRMEMRKYLIEEGFEDVRDRTAASILKTGQDGVARRFTIFLMSGRKRL
jgi:ubiquinone/menaquinone biosynthesis C-methylase UbiE